MDAIKKFFGILWILIGIGGAYYLLANQATPMWKKGGNDIVPAIIYTFILAPIIAGGLITFGMYCLQGEYGEDKK